MNIFQILKQAFSQFGDDECGTRASALAYSTIFALPALLILIVTVAGRIWGAATVQSALEGQFSGIIGPDAAKQIHDIIAHGQNSKGGGILGTVLGAVGLILGATGAFMALQDALNHAWEVAPSGSGGIKAFIGKRLLSFGMVLGLGFLVAVSLALSAAISAVTSSVGTSLPSAVFYVLDLVVSLAVLTFLFAALFKYLPDAKVMWRSVWIGGLATAVLFVVGKFAIGLYLGHSNPGNSFGAASAFAVILVWIYYAGMIVLFGAEFTQVWAKAHNHEIEPRKGAVRTVRLKEGVAKQGEESKADGVDTGKPKTQPQGSPKRLSFKEVLLSAPVLYWIAKNKKR